MAPAGSGYSKMSPTPVLPGESGDQNIGKDDDETVDSKLGGRLGGEVLSWFKKRNGDTLQGALAFVPWVLQQSYFDGLLVEGQTVVHKGKGAVVLTSASGFSALTETLAKKNDGAELLSQCLRNFFTPLIDLINDYHGDVIKFSSDALTVFFPDVDDTKSPKYNRIVPPHGTYGLPDLGPMATAVLRASACCIEIHKRLNMFDTHVDGVCLSLHIGVGCGSVTILQVGGVIPPETHVHRYEYIIAGPPIEQVSIAEQLARDGETCLSPHAWDFVKDCVIEGAPIEKQQDFHILLRMDESKYTFPTIKHAAKENDSRMDKQFRLSELNIIRQYIPSSVFKQLECGTLQYVDEMRHISVIWISGAGLDLMSEKGPAKAQELTSQVQHSCYAHEGTLNKFLMDDKGMLFLLVFGLPPLVHTDDPTRAVLACFDMVKVFKSQGLTGRFGITTSQSYCGVCGSARRMEYTVLGDHVNLAARLMESAPALGILCDEETKNRVSAEIVMNALTPIMPSNKGGSKSEPIAIFQPVRKEQPAQIGLTREGTVRFPWDDNPFGGGGGGSQQLNVQQLCSVKGWVGMAKVQELLGSPFSKALHDSEQTIVRGQAGTHPPPAHGPFAVGGVVVFEGPTGTGKVELCEHIVLHCALRFQTLPVFGTMGPRPGDSVRLATELLRSTLGVFRFLNPNLPVDDLQALTQVVPQQLAGNLPLLRTALHHQTTKEKSSDILETALDVVVGLLGILIKQTSINIVLQFESGTSLFKKTTEGDQNVFWKAVSKLSTFVQKERQNKAGKPIVMVILCREAFPNNNAVKLAIEGSTFMKLSGLKGDAVLEYMSSYLNVPEHIVPVPLRSFVSEVTLGNPLYIRETLDQLQEYGHVMVERQASGSAINVDLKDMDRINIAAWQHTSMVGGTVCLLESLDPLDSAVLKMSTCFQKEFSLPDLAASICSPWADATNFDYLRLFKSIQRLVEKECIDIVDAAPVAEVPGRNPFGNTQYFQMRNLLIRAVGHSMVLEQQKKSVKRQALVDRALSQKLPARMESLARKRNQQHIPWYYEQAFRRM
eukprot:TRINITY_DN4828_c0_g1_i1.p1 TRINITY_DN4828_c0_g1~~TRINITY_DN4828_c0_g1_i1.p1  ORF type:complete len:1057 (+),score=160.87 TRINITY_DN4828_c0_g1_i1:66-3236(+)